MAYQLRRTTQEVLDPKDLLKWVEDEFHAVERSLAETQALDLRPVFREPTRPREGMIVYADGSSWNPGSGEGPYAYKNGTWFALSATASSGPVAGPGSATDNAIARWDGVAGTLLQNSGVVITDANVVAPVVATNAATLGSTASSWGGLFLLSGSTVNWGNGDLILTHGDTGSLTLSSDDNAAPNLVLGTGAAGTNPSYTVNGGASGSNSGGFYQIDNGGLLVTAWGTRSGIYGISYDATTCLVSTTGLKFLTGAGGGNTPLVSAGYLTIASDGTIGSTTVGDFAGGLTLGVGTSISWGGDVSISHSNPNGLNFLGAANGYAFDAKILPATNDGAAIGDTSLQWSDLFLAAGAVINFNSDVQISHFTNEIRYAGATVGYSFGDGPIFPTANDGISLGVAGNAFSDLFLASGAVINLNNGDVTITHQTNEIRYAGATNGYSYADGPIIPTTNDGIALGTSSNGFSDLFLASTATINFGNGDWVETHNNGGSLIVTSDDSAAPNLVLGAGTAGSNPSYTVNAGASGSGAGGFYQIDNGGLLITAWGTRSGIYGIAYDATTVIASTTGLKLLTGAGGGATPLVTAGTLTIGSTGTVGSYANGQIPGTATNDSASAGNVGEIISAVLESGSAVALTTTTNSNIASISLTAGDWDVDGVVHFTGGSTTTFTNGLASVSLTSATLSNNATDASQIWGNGNTLFSAATYVTVPMVRRRISLNSTTTVYLVAVAVFGTSTCSAFGYLRASRAR